MALFEPTHIRRAALTRPRSQQHARAAGPRARVLAPFSALCFLSCALASCAVVLEGKGEADGGEGPAMPWTATLGGAQGGGALEAGAPAGGSGEAAGGPGGGAPGAVGGGPEGPLLGGGDAGTPAAPGMEPPEPVAPCGLAGNFALDFKLDVLWEGTVVDPAFPLPVIDRGAGTLSFLLLGKFHPTGDGSVQGTVRVCDAVVPDFYSSTLREYYAPRFMEDIWDSSAMPSFSFMASRECSPDGSCMWVSQRIHAQLGAELANPAGAWPTNAASAFWPDHDGDRHPGITAHMIGPEPNMLGQSYAYPPVSVFLSRRVNRMMMGLRMQLLLRLQELDCNHVQGGPEEASVDSRAVGCAADTSPFECDSQELAFLDDNLPIWAVNASASTIRGVRMEADATCLATRSAFR